MNDPSLPRRARACRVLLASFPVLALVGCLSSGKPDRETPFSIAEVGFDVPESALHDVEADVYLVSNISGDPFGSDGKGFISRVAPDGEVLDLRWIDGAKDDVALNAPKGMAIVGDVLWVADVTSLRKFDRETGAALGSVDLDGVTFLNDLTASEDGTVWVSDTGLGAGFSASGTDAIWSVSSDGKARLVVKSPTLGQPNGLLATGDGVLMVSWAAGALSAVRPDGTVTTIAKLPQNQLDGIVPDGRGGFLVSSWAGKCVFRVDLDGNVSVVFENIEAPADLGFDLERGRVLVPWFQNARVDVLSP